MTSAAAGEDENNKKEAVVDSLLPSHRTVPTASLWLVFIVPRCAQGGEKGRGGGGQCHGGPPVGGRSSSSGIHKHARQLLKTRRKAQHTGCACAAMMRLTQAVAGPDCKEALYWVISLVGRSRKA